MFDRNKFRAKVIEEGYTLDIIAKKLEINSATLYRKMNGKSDFTRQEIQAIRLFLRLEDELVNEIFFTEKLA